MAVRAAAMRRRGEEGHPGRRDRKGQAMILRSTDPRRLVKPARSSESEGTVKAAATVKGVKVSQLIDPRVLQTPGLIPPDGQPAGNPVIEIAIEGSPLTICAMLNGKSARRALKLINEHGPDGVNLIVQGVLKPGAIPGGPMVLDCAGIVATEKVARPATKDEADA